MALVRSLPRTEIGATGMDHANDVSDRAVVIPPVDEGAAPNTAAIDALTGEVRSTERRRQWRFSRPRVAVPQIQRKRHFVALARWEGAVLERFDSYFVAEVIDLDTDERAIVEFDLTEVSEADRSLCEPGSLFYWSIGYDVKDSGQRSRASVLRFRRLGVA